MPIRASVFGSVEFARISEEQNGYKAHLFVLESGEGALAYPFFLRPIGSLPFASTIASPLWDSLTPEYTGPIARGQVGVSLSGHFADRFSSVCQEQQIVAEFAHLHPWQAHTASLDASCIEQDREIVYVDLSWPEDRLWEDSLTYACQKNIRRARQEKVRVFQAETERNITEFHRIYIQTMERNQALDRYCFPLGYFLSFFELMPDNARFVLAEYKSQIVAATLYLHDDLNVYSYLGGADHAFQRVRPTNAIIYETMRWAKGEGKKQLILGGGYKPNDGIFRFKASFSPLRARFSIYKRIHLPDQYQALLRLWSAHHGRKATMDSYFPAYRAVPQTD